LIQKNEAKKNQDCACFTQKTCARLTKSFKLAAAQLKHERFFTSILLVFWLIRQGRSRPATPQLRAPEYRKQRSSWALMRHRQ